MSSRRIGKETAMDVIEHDVKFEKMFKELEDDPEYLKELKDIEDGEKEISAKSKEQERKGEGDGR